MRFILNRLGFYIVTFFCAAILNFFLPRMMDGDPITNMFMSGPTPMPPEALEAVKETFGFVTGPWYVQFAAYMKSIFTWDLGVSVLTFPQLVSDKLADALVWTLYLVGTSTILSFSIGSVLGVLAAWKRGEKFDSFISPFTMVIQSFPPVVVSLIALFGLGISLKWFPISYAFDPNLDPAFTMEFFSSLMLHSVLPIGTLAVVQLGGFLITMRNNMINLLGEDFVTMGRAKGLSKPRVIFNYAARNAILPSVTSLAMALGFVLAGALVTEIVFNYPGLGYILFNAILSADYPVIQGHLLITVFFMLICNFVADVLYVFCDPRLRTS